MGSILSRPQCVKWHIHAIHTISAVEFFSIKWLVVMDLMILTAWMFVYIYNFSYPLFADADTGIYSHAVSQYHARPKAKGVITMLCVGKFSYPLKQTRGNEFIPWSNNVCHILKRVRIFKISVIPSIWPKSLFEYSVTAVASQRQEEPPPWSPSWRHQWRSFPFISHDDDVKREKLGNVICQWRGHSSIALVPNKCGSWPTGDSLPRPDT